VEDGGTSRGLLTVRDLSNVPHAEWGHTTAADVMTRWDDLAQVAPDTELFDVLVQMDQAGIVQVPVFEGEHVVGTVSRDEVLRYVRLRAQLGY
jgi:predicted transcriptional regulator